MAFIVEQVIKKAIEYIKSAYLCFIDMTKIFDWVITYDTFAIYYEK